MPLDLADFRIDSFDRLWLPTIFVTIFGGLGEWAFTVIAAVAFMVGGFALAGAIGLYGSGTRTEGSVAEPARVRRNRRAGTVRALHFLMSLHGRRM
jgi:hypothetical protein